MTRDVECRTIAGLLSSYSACDADSEDESAIHAHLNACRKCRIAVRKSRNLGLVGLLPLFGKVSAQEVVKTLDECYIALDLARESLWNSVGRRSLYDALFAFDRLCKAANEIRRKDPHYASTRAVGDDDVLGTCLSQVVGCLRPIKWSGISSSEGRELTLGDSGVFMDAHFEDLRAALHGLRSLETEFASSRARSESNPWNWIIAEAANRFREVQNKFTGLVWEALCAGCGISLECRAGGEPGAMVRDFLSDVEVIREVLTVPGIHPGILYKYISALSHQLLELRGASYVVSFVGSRLGELKTALAAFGDRDLPAGFGSDKVAALGAPGSAKNTATRLTEVYGRVFAKPIAEWARKQSADSLDATVRKRLLQLST